jgi:hypothetical protein
MRLSSKLKSAGTIMALVALTTVSVLAQTDAAGGTGGGQVTFQKQQQLTPQQQIVEADSQIARMEQASGTVRRQLEVARAARDVVKVLCLNDKLSQIDVAARSAKDRRQSLQLAIGRSDGELGNHEFTILTVLRQRTEQLTAEANQCIGEEATLIGESKITTTVDPTLPPDDDTNFRPDDPNIIYTPPSCTSCSD